jgi:hypothetical protein
MNQENSSADAPAAVQEPITLEQKLRRIKAVRGITAGSPSGTEMLLEDRRLKRERELAEEGF